MQHLTILISLIVPLLVAASCRATDGDPPASRPSSLTTSTKIVHEDATWVVEVTLTNATGKPRSTGRYLRFTLTRVDTKPAQIVAATPEQVMAPHFRVLLPPGESRKASVPIWDKADPLPPGQYHASITFPPDMLASSVETDFTVEPPTSRPHQP